MLARSNTLLLSTMGGDGRSAIEVVGGLGVEEGGDQGSIAHEAGVVAGAGVGNASTRAAAARTNTGGTLDIGLMGK